MYASRGHGSAGYGVDAVLCVFREGSAFADMDFDISVIVEDFFVDPEVSPARIVDFSTESRGFALLVEFESFDVVEVCIECDESVHGRPQAVSVDGQDDGFDLIFVIIDEVDGGVARFFDNFCGVMFEGGEGVDAFVKHIEFEGIEGLIELLCFEVDDSRFDAVELFFDGECGVEDSGDFEDIFSFVIEGVSLLEGSERYGTVGNEHGTDKAKPDGDGDGFARFVRRGFEPFVDEVVFRSVLHV